MMTSLMFMGTSVTFSRSRALSFLSADTTDSVGVAPRVGLRQSRNELARLAKGPAG
jgi:hypothetical protein